MEIEEWFKCGKPFKQGVYIYLESNPNPRLLSQMQQYIGQRYIPESIREYLSSELKKIITKKTKGGVKPIENSNPVNENNGQENYKERMKKQAALLHKKQAELHSMMRNTRSSSRRLIVASEIMEVVIPELDSLYSNIRKYDSSGHVVHIEPEIDPTSLMKKLNSIQSRISRLKKLIPAATGKTQEKYQIELREKEILKAEINKKLEK